MVKAATRGKPTEMPGDKTERLAHYGQNPTNTSRECQRTPGKALTTKTDRCGGHGQCQNNLPKNKVRFSQKPETATAKRPYWTTTKHVSGDFGEERVTPKSTYRPAKQRAWRRGRALSTTPDRPFRRPEGAVLKRHESVAQ